METNYQKYLNKLDLIDEKTFNEILDSFPEIEDFDDITICEDDKCEDDLCMSLFDYFLEDYPYIYCEDVDFFSKQFSLYGSETVEELETVKNLFPKWKMINYEEELEDLKEREEEQKKESEEEKLRKDLINYISKASIEELHNLKENFL